MLCYAAILHAMLFYAILWHVTLYYARLYHSKLRCDALWCAALLRSVMYYAVIRYAEMPHDVAWCAVLCYSMLFFFTLCYSSALRVHYVKQMHHGTRILMLLGKIPRSGSRNFNHCQFSFSTAKREFSYPSCAHSRCTKNWLTAEITQLNIWTLRSRRKSSRRLSQSWLSPVLK